MRSESDWLSHKGNGMKSLSRSKRIQSALNRAARISAMRTVRPNH